MATVRIQVRRGTASQWSTTNPVLAAGEMGVETDTNLFKFGNGTSTWTALSYANNSDVAIGEISQDAINNALSLGAGLTKTYNDGANTITITVDSDVVALKSYVDGLVSDLGNASDAAYIPQDDRGAANGVASLNAQSKVPTSEIDTTVIATRAYAEYLQGQDIIYTDVHSNKTTNIHGIADTSLLATTAQVELGVNSAKSYTDTKKTEATGYTDSAIDSLTDYVDAYHTAALAAASDAESAAKTYADNKSTQDRTYTDGKVSGHENDTTNIHGIADTSLLATKSYADTAASTAQTAAISSASTSLSTHAAATTSVHGITDTSKIVFTTDSGTVTSTMIANGTIVDADINASAAIAQSKVASLTSDLAAKAPLAGPTFTGTVTLPSTTAIGNVSATEIGYIDGVTSAIQTQLDAKLASATAASTYAPIASPTFTGTVSGVTKAMVGLGNADNTSDANKPVSTATQTALDAKLALAGGTMTGALTLSGAPTVDLHAATKAYVDNVVAGINFHQPVRVATTANITLSGTQTIDGVSLSVGDRVLVKDQTDAKTNGIYVVASSTWSRATDADNNPVGELAGGDFCLVLEGTVGAGYGYVCSNTSTITIGSTNITYAAYNAAKAVTAGSGLTESTPGTLDIATGGVTSAMIADGTIVNADINASAAIAATKIAGTAITAADTGTVTSTMIADGTIVDGDINASAAIAQSKISGLSTSLGLKAPLADPTFTGTVTVASAGIAFTDGTQSKEGVPSRTPIVQKTASYTLSSLTERDNLIEVSSSSATTLTIPADSTVNYPVGTSIDILQTSTGQVTIAGAGGVTVNATPGLKLRTQWSSASLLKRAANTWVVMGDLSA